MGVQSHSCKEILANNAAPVFSLTHTHTKSHQSTLASKFDNRPLLPKTTNKHTHTHKNQTHKIYVVWFDAVQIHSFINKRGFSDATLSPKNTGSTENTPRTNDTVCCHGV